MNIALFVILPLAGLVVGIILSLYFFKKEDSLQESIPPLYKLGGIIGGVAVVFVFVLLKITNTNLLNILLVCIATPLTILVSTLGMFRVWAIQKEGNWKNIEAIEEIVYSSIFLLIMNILAMVIFSVFWWITTLGIDVPTIHPYFSHLVRLEPIFALIALSVIDYFLVYKIEMTEHIKKLIWMSVPLTIIVIALLGILRVVPGIM